MLFDITVEDRDIGEVQLLGDGIDCHIGVQQQHLRFLQDTAVNPVLHRLTGLLSDNCAQVVRRDAKPVGIERNRVFLRAVRCHQSDEAFEKFLAAREVRGLLLDSRASA